MIFESATIATYFARCAPASGLLGQSAFETAKVDEWVRYTQSAIWPTVMPVVKAALGHEVVAQTVFNAAVNKLKAAVKVLNTYLTDKHFLVGDNLTIADVVAACSLVMPFQTVLDAGFRKGMPAVSEWFERCCGLPSFVRRMGYVKMTEKAFKAFDPNAKPEVVAAPVKAAPAKAAPVKNEAEEDMDDLFGDDNEDDAAAAAAVAAAAKAKATAAAKPKKVVIAMSIVMLEVKPMDDLVNLDDLAKKLIAEITMDGLYWKTDYKKEPVAFGIFKLIVGFSLEDDKVSVDDIVEKIEAYEELVQSVEIAVFNKI
jgi:glutathione S-transferase/translation elongation factor EF-1beta